MNQLTIRSTEDADRLLDRIRLSAVRARDHLVAHTDNPLDMFKRMKFDPIGFHPIDDRPLNLVEQINQTWTYSVAIVAARQLLAWHPDAGGFYLAPGAHASLDLDIMSDAEGLVGAETFAAVTPGNNNKLNKDLAKLAKRPETHRYVFFMSPGFPGNVRLPKFEQNGIEVWSVDV